MQECQRYPNKLETTEQIQTKMNKKIKAARQTEDRSVVVVGLLKRLRVFVQTETQPIPLGLTARYISERKTCLLHTTRSTG